MKILSMTATFGKLDGEKLILKPDLNVFTAPNEWGKSTWCAFILDMLYGIKTSDRTLPGKVLADKDHYAPWNGKPMSGRMDILWKGRNITIERSNKGRTPFGNFKAYETDTGMEIPELTATNCGLTLLGVEKEVFARAGFIRHTDMPVSDDGALRRRLNELVTTGDESGKANELAEKLKAIKNGCRYNQRGLLPQAEAQRDLITDKLGQIETARLQMEKISQRQEEIRSEIHALENHKAMLAYQDATGNLQRVDQARADYEAAQNLVRSLETQCSDLPAEEFAQKKLRQAEQIQNRWTAFQAKQQPLPPEAPAVFADIGSGAAYLRSKLDKVAYDDLQKATSPLLLILAVLSLLAGVGLFFIDPLLILAGVAFAVVFGALHFVRLGKKKAALSKLKERYGDLPADQWVDTANQYGKAEKAYEQSLEELKKERALLQEDTEALTGGKSLQELVETNRETIALWAALRDAKEDAKKAAQHAEAMASMVKDVAKPQVEDTLTYTKEETDRRLADLTWEQGDLQRKQGQFMGQVQTLGSAEDLQRQLEQVKARICKLEDYYAAATIALETLAETTNELQRRFAPQIAQKAQELFCRLTGGRYDRLILGQDLSVSVAATGEDTLHEALWRSDGTVDQLYLSVRLAVAQALTPEAPVLLDDAFVRFDEKRLAAAMALLKEESLNKQIIIFSCHDREEKYA